VLKARTKVAEALSLIVRQRRKGSEAGERKNDMLEALLAGDDGFSDEQIVDFLLALLVAGYETTSTIMTLAVKFLTETPLALAQLKVCSFSLSHSLSAATFVFFFTLSFGGLFYVANNSLSSHGPITAPTKQKMHTCFASL